MVAARSVHVEEESIYKIADLAKAEGVRAIPMVENILDRAICDARAAKFGASAGAGGQPEASRDK